MGDSRWAPEGLQFSEQEDTGRQEQPCIECGSRSLHRFLKFHWCAQGRNPCRVDIKQSSLEGWGHLTGCAAILPRTPSEVVQGSHATCHLEGSRCHQITVTL